MPASLRSILRITRAIFILIVSVYATAMITYLLIRLLVGDGYWRVSFINTFAHWLLFPVLVMLPLACILRTRQVVYGLMPIFITAVIWIVPYFLPKFISPPTGTVIRVLTLNTRALIDNMQPVEQFLIESGADVVLLQEVNATNAASLLPSLRDTYPYQSDWSTKPVYSDNQLLSKFPIESIDYFELGLPDTRAPIHAVLNIHGTQVAIYNVHLDWPGAYARPAPAFLRGKIENNFILRSVLGFDDAVRNRQITALLEILKSEPQPFVVGGDFNMSDFAVTYGQVAARLHDSFREGGWGMGASWPIMRIYGLPSFTPPLVRIDYLWHNDDFRTIKASQGIAVGSDHLPLIAELELLDS